MSLIEKFLIAMVVIYALPYLTWKLFRTEAFAPLVVIQIIGGILLGPGVLGAIFPEQHTSFFSPDVMQSLNAIAWWAIMLFVCIAGIELDLHTTWQHRRESSISAGLALGTPMLMGCVVAIVLLVWQAQWGGEWLGEKGLPWQFVVGIGMSCAVTALPILILFMEKLSLLRQPLGQRILRYASLDDIAIWAVLALILMDWQRLGKQGLFLLGFVAAAWCLRKFMQHLPESDRWHVALIWLLVCSLASDWSGLHFMVGAFLAGVALDGSWFNRERMDLLRHHVLLTVMPVFFLSTGLKTQWDFGAEVVIFAAALLLIASVGGKLLGVHIAARILNWPKGEASIVGWLLQTKALIMIIFANILLDKDIISNSTFTALLLMAVVSTMLSIPMVTKKVSRLKSVHLPATSTLDLQKLLVPNDSLSQKSKIKKSRKIISENDIEH